VTGWSSSTDDYGMDQSLDRAIDEACAADRIEVLVAESDPFLRAVLSWVLDHDGRFRVAGQAETGEEAARFGDPYQLVLLDLRIAGLGGLGTIERIHQRTPSPLVVILSETSSVYLRHAAAAEGALGFILRPEDLGHLADRLFELTRGVAANSLP